MSVRNFLQSLSAGDNISARDYLDSALGEKATQFLELRKQQMAQSLFDTGESFEEDSDEQEES